jgi:hypothetical protein
MPSVASTYATIKGRTLGKLIKYLFYIAVLVLIFLVGYSFFGDLSPRKAPVIQTIPMPDGT